MNTTEIATLDSVEVPSYVLNPELAKQANEEAMAGISTGFAARIKLAGKQFTLVDGNGEETPVMPGDMVTAPDGNLYLPVIVLRAKMELQKSWYASAFNPAEDAKAPDCFSNDGLKPDATAPSPQCDNCAQCPMNAFGSGKDQAGNATKGKACGDTKILAVFVPNKGVHKFKLPPASLKNWGLYVKNLSTRGIPVGNVKTLVGFDLTATYPILKFEFGGFIPEQMLPKLAEVAQSAEAEEIANDRITATAALPAPETAEQPTQQAQPAAQAQTPPADDMGLGLDDTPATQAAEPVQQAQEQPAAAGPTDDELAAELGL